MQITTRTWNNYIARLSRLNEAAGQKMREYIRLHGTENTEQLISYAYAVITRYGEGSAELACQMYDALAEAEGVLLPAAEPAATAGYGEVARMVRATKDQHPENLPSGVSRLVKRAGADTTLHNAVRDGAEWAWVPHGDTCPFCITLASNGWQRASQKLLKGGHAEHIHSNCDCEFAVRFDHRTNVAGYDPEKYLKQYRAAGSDVNAMRRIDYAARKDAINAQKRAAYAARVKQSVEMTRKAGYTHQKTSAEGAKIIPQALYNKLTNPIERVGGLVLRGTPDIEEHLKKQGATALQVGDIIMFRSDATISDVLEETYHFWQNQRGMNDDKPIDIRTALNEIDAKEHLINVSEKYKIPVEETVLTKQQLEYYKNLLKELEGKK